MISATKPAVTARWVLPSAGTVTLVVALVALAANALVLRLVGLTLMLSAAGCWSEALVRRVRSRSAQWAGPMRPMVYPRLPRNPLAAQAVSLGRSVRARFDGVDWVGDWLPGLLAAFAGGLVLNALRGDVFAPGWLDIQPPLWIAIVLLASVVPAVFLQRLAHAWDEKTGEHLGIESLVRLPLLAVLVGGISSLLTAQGYLWANVALYVIGAALALAAAEILLRAVAQVFFPLGAFAARKNPALPWFPSLLRPALPRPARAVAWLRDAYGLDLARSWVLAFLARAALPVAGFVAVLAWLSTGVTVLGISERAIIETLGRPVAVVGPGLHLHAPWPFGAARPVELGVVHQLPIVFSGKPGGRLLAELASAGAADAESAMGAEAIPGRTADRLWDETHPGEASYLIASRSNDREGFQIVNVDLRVVFRIPDDDASAMQSAYAATEPASLIRATAGRLLVSHFSSATLDELLGESRAGFVDRFQKDLQQRIDAFGTGISIVNVVVEAIHPPGGAAAAYHNVQAASIRSDAMRFRSRAQAFGLRGSASQEATRTVNQARAAASETLADAEATRASFNASTQSLRAGPDVFVFESWLSHVGNALNRAHLTIIDHRLDGEKATLDLRPVAAGTGTSL